LLLTAGYIDPGGSRRALSAPGLFRSSDNGFTWLRRGFFPAFLPRGEVTRPYGQIVQGRDGTLRTIAYDQFNSGAAYMLVSRDDGLTLRDAWISAPVHCAPPGNKPTPDEILRCRRYLERELDLLVNAKVVVVLGRIAFQSYLSILRDRGLIARVSDFVFGHNRAMRTGPRLPLLITSYHPSQQNTSTGRLTAEMLREVFARARQAIQE
jgi:uracil-DNA glycosylase family 4